MITPELVRTCGRDDQVHQRLTKAIEKRERAYLWTPADTISFIPRVLPNFYGDGRALFAIATINQRPAYWVIRVCSTWGSGFDIEEASGPDFAEMTDDILTDLEEAFGNGRCGYSGTSLFQSRRDRMRYCKCEDCVEPGKARWPMVDGCGGCSWSRIDWPAGFDVVRNPLAPSNNILAAKRRRRKRTNP